MNVHVDAITAANLRLLQRCRPFSACGLELLTALAAQGHRGRYSRNEPVWRAGALADHFTLIVHGLVKIVRTEPSGVESIVALFGPRESVGDLAVFGRKPYPASAFAASDALEVLRVPAAPLLEAAAREPALSQAVADSVLEHTQALQTKIQIMTAGDVPRRLAMLLLHLAERFGDELEGGETSIPVALSRGELADMVGARVETVIRTLSKWQKAGLVDARGEGFRVPHLEALSAILGESSPGEV